MGLHRRRADRRGDRLRDLCRQCEPRQRHQVLLRRLGISQPARPQPRGAYDLGRGTAATCRACRCRAIFSSAPPTGSISTSRRCCASGRRSATWCSISAWSPASTRPQPTAFRRSSRWPTKRAPRLVLVNLTPELNAPSTAIRFLDARTASSSPTWTRRWNPASMRSSPPIGKSGEPIPCAAGSPTR